jgi:hypothetical protein
MSGVRCKLDYAPTCPRVIAPLKAIKSGLFTGRAGHVTNVIRRGPVNGVVQRRRRAFGVHFG